MLNIESAFLSALIIVDVIFFDVSHTPLFKLLLKMETCMRLRFFWVFVGFLQIQSP